MTALEQMIAANRETISKRLAEIATALAAIRRRGGFANLADVWVLEKERRKLRSAKAKLRVGSACVCSFCGGVKSFRAKSCGKCRSDAHELSRETDAIAAHASEESRRILSQLPRRRVDRHKRVFRRWRRWRRKFVHKVLGGPLNGKNACACGAYKTTCASMCDTCQDAKTILKRRVAQRGRDNRDEPPISRHREPRVLRLLTPGMYESDPGNGWDDIIKIIEENR